MTEEKIWEFFEKTLNDYMTPSGLPENNPICKSVTSVVSDAEKLGIAYLFPQVKFCTRDCLPQGEPCKNIRFAECVYSNTFEKQGSDTHNVRVYGILLSETSGVIIRISLLGEVNTKES